MSSEKKKQYYQANKEKIMTQRKQNYEKNKEAIKAYSRSYYQRNKERANTKARERGRASSFEERKHQKLKRLYGLTLESYNELLEEQNGLCAICELPERRVIKGMPTHLCVDHNHQTGLVRQLLCYRCNVILGSCEEDPSLLDKLKNYLHRHNKNNPLEN